MNKTLYLLLFIFISCGKSEQAAVETTLSGVWDTYALESVEDCHEINGNAVAHIINEGEEQIVRHDILEYDSISQFYYQSSEVDYYKYPVTEKLKKLPICHNHDYQKDTLQDIALTSAYGIERAHKLLKSVGENFGQVKLVSAPVLYQGSKKKVQVLNAFYMRANSNDAYITFLPNSDIVLDSPRFNMFEKNNYSLWKYPFVAAHEYGHHVFFEILSEAVPEVSKMRCHLHSSEDEDMEFFILKSLNEAFADLLAHYATGSDYSLPYVFDFDKSRNVMESEFAGGVAKKFTNKIVENIKLQSDALIVNNVGVPKIVRLRDPHVVGAIFAHHFYTLHDHLEKKDALKRLIKWARTFKNLALDDQSNFLEKAYQALELTSNDDAYFNSFMIDTYAPFLAEED